MTPSSRSAFFSTRLIWTWLQGYLKTEADIREAIVLAQKTNAKAWELRAALDLAQILKARGDVATACGLLAPLCAKFTEGHDTVDWKDAQALLKELNG